MHREQKVKTQKSKVSSKGGSSFGGKTTNQKSKTMSLRAIPKRRDEAI